LQRRDFLRSAAVGVTATTLATPAIAQPTPEISWRLASGFERPLSLVRSAAEIFARQLAELTDGRFQLQILSAMGPAIKALDAVSAGSVEMVHASSQECYAKDPTFAVASRIPFGLSGRQQNAWLSQGGGNEAFNTFLKAYNVYGIPLGNTGARMGGWYRKEIKSAGDLSGLKISIEGIAGDVLARLGATPQDLAPSTVAAALEHGTLDGVEWDGGYSDEAEHDFIKAAPYCYAPGFAVGGASLHCFINLDAWNSLPNSYRSALANAAVNANSWVEARTETQTPSALKSLVAAGAKLRSFPRDVIEAAERAANDLYIELSAKNANFKTMFELMMAFRDDELLSSQLAEYSNDMPRFTAEL
jgi:TRAP-type mannitol/chloroaromatic compound transport system substrate-binding protein